MALSIADLIKMFRGAPLKVDLNLALVLSGIEIGSIRVKGTIGFLAEKVPAKKVPAERVPAKKAE